MSDFKKAVLLCLGVCAILVNGAGYTRVLLSEVKTLTFTADRFTSGRRSSAVQQLSCKGDYCKEAPLKTASCLNMGTDGKDMQWKCEADMPANIAFASVEVGCEGFEYADDPFILHGSCQLEYTLALVSPPSPGPSMPAPRAPAPQKEPPPRMETPKTGQTEIPVPHTSSSTAAPADGHILFWFLVGLAGLSLAILAFCCTYSRPSISGKRSKTKKNETRGAAIFAYEKLERRYPRLSAPTPSAPTYDAVAEKEDRASVQPAYGSEENEPGSENSSPSKASSRPYVRHQNKRSTVSDRQQYTSTAHPTYRPTPTYSSSTYSPRTVPSVPSFTYTPPSPPIVVSPPPVIVTPPPVIVTTAQPPVVAVPPILTPTISASTSASTSTSTSTSPSIRSSESSTTATVHRTAYGGTKRR